MRKIIVLLMLLFTFIFSVQAEEWIRTDNSRGLIWYYSPEHTTINAQGRLETWLKSESETKYTVWVVYVNKDFEKELTAKITEYKIDGSIIREKAGYEWNTLQPGSSFEKSLQAAYKYVNDK